jgi:toxin ParE1/3/4
VTLPVVFTAAARADILDAVEWYEARQSGLGRRFIADLEALTVRMGGNPLQFPVMHNGVRRGALRRFPYGVFFRALPEQVQVLACFHTSRDPIQWQRRT